MYRILFSFLLGSMVILMSSFPLHADSEVFSRQEERQDLALAVQTNHNPLTTAQYRHQDNVARYYGGTYGYPTTTTYANPTTIYGSSYGTYGTSAYPTTIYGSSYGTHGYNYPSYSLYSTSPTYPNPYVSPSTSLTYPNTYVYPGYNRAYYYNPGMYNPNTTFVNPPPSMNYPTGYPTYSQTYIYR